MIGAESVYWILEVLYYVATTTVDIYICAHPVVMDVYTHTTRPSESIGTMDKN